MALTGITYKDVSFTGDQTNAAVWTPASGKRIIVVGWIVTLSASGSLILSEGNNSTSTNILRMSVTSNGGDSRMLWESAPIAFATDAVLKITTTGGGNAAGTIYGYEEA